MGVDAEGKKIADFNIKHISPILVDLSILNNEKVRLIALYVLMNKNGITVNSFNKLATHANIEMIRNLTQLGVNVISDVKSLF